MELYRLDIIQYAQGSDKVKIKSLFDSVPSQRDTNNRRFILTAIAPTGRQLRYADNFNWLADAGVALPCYNVTEPQPPLKINEKHNLFKLYMGDTGLLCAACMENIQFALLNGELEINMGSILENMMAQQLKSNGYDLHYYEGKKTGEIDFVIQNGTHVDLVEVKSGNDYHAHPALHKIRKTEGWKFGQATVLCKGNLEEGDGIRYVPWYMILFLRPQPLPETMIVEVDLSGL